MQDTLVVPNLSGSHEKDKIEASAADGKDIIGFETSPLTTQRYILDW